MSGPTDLDSLFEAGSGKFGDAFLLDPNRRDTPEWYDEGRFKSGQLFFIRHAISVSFSYLCSLYVGFTVESLANAVSFTGESDTPDRSRRRYMNTMGHLYSWHISDVINDRSSIGYRSIRYVRDWHDRVRKKMASADDTRPIDRYISQYDIAVVQIGFVAPIILYPRHFGIRCSQDDLADYVYFWRVVGYVLGLEDGVNACGVDLRTTMTISKQIEQRMVLPGLMNPSDRFIRLSETLMNGMKAIWPPMNSKIIRGYLFPLVGLQKPEMNWKDYFYVKFLQLHFFLMYWIPFYSNYWNRTVYKLLGRLLVSVEKNLP